PEGVRTPRESSQGAKVSLPLGNRDQSVIWWPPCEATGATRSNAMPHFGTRPGRRPPDLRVYRARVGPCDCHEDLSAVGRGSPVAPAGPPLLRARRSVPPPSRVP